MQAITLRQENETAKQAVIYFKIPDFPAELKSFAERLFGIIYSNYIDGSSDKVY